MKARKPLRSVHLASTIWFALCVGYVLALALRQAGFKWWLIFSLSGHSALFVFLLVSMYLFALYRGIGGAQQIVKEHPLTTTSQYMGFYVLAPFLGGVAGCIGMLGAPSVGQFMLGVALGTLGATFSVWVIVDPVAGLVEMLLPDSRRHRAVRLAEAEAERKLRQERREELLNQVISVEQADVARWQKELRPEAERLVGLLDSGAKTFVRAEREAVDIGSRAWQIGGLHCMRELREMALTLYRDRHQNMHAVDYISTWWDGIGTWREPSPG